MKQNKAMVAFYATHKEAEGAIVKLHESGFDMKMLSIVGTDYYTNETVTGYYTTGDRMKKWGSYGAFWGGFWGLLFGSGFFIIPGIGPLLIAGPLVAALVGSLEGAAVAGSISALGAVLISLGIPKHEVLESETEIKAGKYMLVVHGTEAHIENARKLLAIHIPKENLSAEDQLRVLSGGETSPFQ